jgi:hypothetical protein
MYIAFKILSNLSRKEYIDIVSKLYENKIAVENNATSSCKAKHYKFI